MRYAICYVSNAVRNISKAEIYDVLKYTQDYNEKHDITGILLSSEGNFFQVIEGETSAIKALFNKIENDKRHFNILKIFEKEIVTPEYKGYKTKFISEVTRADDISVEKYMAYTENLDEATRLVVQNMIRAFIISN